MIILLYPKGGQNKIIPFAGFLPGDASVRAFDQVLWAMRKHYCPKTERPEWLKVSINGISQAPHEEET